MTKTINVSDATYEAIKDQLSEDEKLDINELEDFVGKKLFIRTVTFHYTGHVEKIVGGFLVLSDAAWIADSGRFSNSIKTGLLNEVEPIGEAFVQISTIVDMIPWYHPLPMEQK